KSAAYLKAITLRRGKKQTAESAKALQDTLQKNDLDATFTQAFQPRLRRYDPVFGPLRMFMDVDAAEFAKRAPDVMANVNRQSSLNPLLAAAFKEAPTPANIDDVIAIYAKVFTNIAPQTIPYLNACAAAKVTGPVQGFDAPTAELAG